MELSECERSVEITRRVLIDSNEFDPFQIFKKLDIENKNYISPKDIINFMSLKNINIFLEEAKFIIFFYDKDQDGLLSFDEFLNLIQSKNPKVIKNKNDINYSIKNEMSYKIEFSFTKLMEKEIKLVQKMMNYINLFKFDLHDIYHQMKSVNINCITKESLKNFLEKNDVSFLDSDLNFIFNRLDINQDGKIDFKEFHSFFGFPNYFDIDEKHFCPFCCNEYLLETKESNYQNLNEEFTYPETNIIYNYKDDFKGEKLSKSLSLRLGPERKYDNGHRYDFGRESVDHLFYSDNQHFVCDQISFRRRNRDNANNYRYFACHLRGNFSENARDTICFEICSVNCAFCRHNRKYFQTDHYFAGIMREIFLNFVRR